VRLVDDAWNEAMRKRICYCGLSEHAETEIFSQSDFNKIANETDLQSNSSVYIYLFVKEIVRSSLFSRAYPRQGQSNRSAPRRM